MSFFCVDSLSAGYGKGNVIENLSFSMEKGMLVGILGANGSGKTTLLKAVCGILPHRGSCSLEEAKLEGLSPRQLARQVISNLKGKFPAMEYTFGAKSVQLTGADTTVLEYKEILLLTFDSKYLYIFIQNRSAYMIERSSIKPDEKGLMQFLTEKTGLSWSRPGSMAKLSSLPPAKSVKGVLR